jgi:tRNA A-37 threonylcarbamoyl transferase component Bud32
MSPELHGKVRKLFDAALEKPEPERLAFVQAESNGDPQVLQAVTRLLEAHRSSEAFLETDARPTQRIGRYLVTGELGRGAMGIVYQAIDPLIGRKLAVKVIHLRAFANAGEAQFLRDRLFREARSAGALSHPGIVVVFDVGQEGDLAFIAMERVEGVSLYQVLASGRKIPHAEAFEILRQTAAALDYAHRNGVVHRDIKPANIMLDKGVTVKVADFGVAKITTSEHHTITGVVMGTPSYMSPEQIEALPSDGRSDQFSLAVVAYELLTGRRPFQSDSLATLTHMIVYADRPSAHALNPALPPAVDMIFSRGLARLPTGRYASCADFVCALEECLKAAPIPQPVRMPAASPAPMAAQSVGRRRWYLGAAVLLLALLGAAVLYKGWLPAREPPQPEPPRQIGEGPAAPVITQFIVDPPSIESGATATLRWDVKGASEVAIDPGIGRVAVSDKSEVRPMQTTIYTLTATGPGGKAMAPVSVNVKPGKPDKSRRVQLYDDAVVLLKTNQIAKALKLFRQAAQLGEPRAMSELGEIYVDDNPTEAAVWFRKAADAGDASSKLNLGVMYYFGNGVFEDYAVAAYWYGQAVAAGNPDAMYNLGRMYENGQGVAKDLGHAKDLYTKAVSLGNAEASVQLARLNGKRK